MRKWTLCVLALTMVGVVAVEAQAGGGRRGRSSYRPMASSYPVNSSQDQVANGQDQSVTSPGSSEPTSSVTRASWDSPPVYQYSPAPTYYSSSRCVGGG